MTHPSLTENKLATTIAAWVIMLAGSLLPTVLWVEITGSEPQVWVWFRLGLLAVLFAAGFFIGFLKPLRAFIIVLFILYAAPMLIDRINFSIPFISAWFGNGVFIRSMQPEQFNKLAVSLTVILGLILCGYRRTRMFLVSGSLKAPITPVPWLGFPKPDSWVRFGGQYSLYLALGTAAVLWITSHTPSTTLVKTLSLLPTIVCMAALNAFNEEMIYRSAVLTTLENSIGRNNVWALSAVFFGIAHFYGVPNGWIGIALATFMGWLLAKAMLETRGFFWSWWIHFLQDVFIFLFIAAGTVTAGG